MYWNILLNVLVKLRKIWVTRITFLIRYYLADTILCASHDNSIYNCYYLFSAYYVLEIIPLNIYKQSCKLNTTIPIAHIRPLKLTCPAKKQWNCPKIYHYLIFKPRIFPLPISHSHNLWQYFMHLHV